MKIASIELIEVFVPYIEPIRAAEWPDHPHTIARVRTDEGLTGLGESWTPRQNIGSLESYIGRNPLEMDIASLHAPLQSALYDIAGQALGLPAWRLIGDRVRERIPVAYWSCHMPPESTAKEAEKAVALGFKVHKLKARSRDIVRQAELITKAAAGADYAIRVDPNTEFTYVDTAVKLARQLEPYHIDCYEDPVLKQNLDWYRLLRQKLDIPQALHLGDPAAVLDAVRAGAADRFNIGGNVASVLKCAAIAEAAQCPIWLQTGGLCLGIQTAFSAHLQAVLPGDILPCDELPFVREDSLVGDSLLIREGHISVPTCPGLGVVLDEKAVERYRTG
ncbi:MAG: hypothetical protein IT210_07065 [Armatimonadetes bacterium]|nr:hypothetical protein [Armatimonadota bacterium]